MSTPVSPYLYRLALVACLACELSATSYASIVVHVSPSGNNAWNGLSATASGGGAGPVATLERARDIVRAYRLSTGNTAESTIRISAGTYHFSSGIILDQRDSRLRIEAAGNGAVRFMGGRFVNNWALVNPMRPPAGLNRAFVSRIFQANLPNAGISNYGNLVRRSAHYGTEAPAPLELIFNGTPMRMAQFPNTGFATITSVSGSGFRLGSTLKRYTAPASTGQAFGYFAFDWADFSEGLISMDTSGNVQTTMPMFGYAVGGRVRIVNFIEDLDSPGEFFVNRNTGIAYLFPPSNITPNSVVATTLDQPIIRVVNANQVTFSGLTIENSRGRGLEVETSSGIRLEYCTIRNVGREGAFIARSSNSGLFACVVSDTGTTAVVLEGGDRTTLTDGELYVESSQIMRFGRIEQSGRPGVSIKGVGNRVVGSTITDGPQMGVLFSGNNHVIQRNHLARLCTEAADMGAIYGGRDVTALGNVIADNYIVDVTSRLNRPDSYNGIMGIYLDDAISGTTVRGNAFHNVSIGIQIGGGSLTSVRNNLFSSTPVAIKIDARGKTWLADAFSGSGLFATQVSNLGQSLQLYRTRYPEWSAWLNSDWSLPRNLLTQNIYPASNSLFFHNPEHTVAATTMTQNWILPNPAMNPSLLDFRVSDPAVASAIGFAPIATNVGIQGPVGAGAADGSGSSQA